MDFISFEERARSTEWNMMKLESHPYFEVYFLLEGERTIIVQDEILTAKAGTALIIPPFTPHRTEGGPYRRINAYVSPKSLDEDTLAYLTDNQAPLVFLLRGNETSTPYSLLSAACSMNKEKSKNAVEFKKGFFYSLLFYLKKCTPVRLEGGRSLSRTDEQLRRVITYLHEHWEEKITIADLCQKFFFTKSNLCKKFKRTMDCSISDYLLFVRLNKAKDLLFNTDEEIQRIADACGFSSLNYFSLTFKQKIGVSPTAYRKTR